MISHKFIDALRGVSPEKKLRLYGATPADAKAFAELLNDAEKFDFGPLVLEYNNDGWAIPNLTQDEKEAFNEGLIPLPAPVCWFEFQLGNLISGILIRENWVCTRLDWSNNFIFDNNRCSVDLQFFVDDDDKITIEAPKDFIEQNIQVYLTVPLMAIYLTIMLNSRSTEITESVPPVRLNRARAKRGRTELASHRIVRIVPDAYLRERRAESGLTRLPPRLHYRRSHIRTLHRGTAQQRRILIPRFLVGRASDAEVSHEYRIVK
jgi:hypothetical protein